nr:hypothetical protein [Microscillaceae bacterium]
MKNATSLLLASLLVGYIGYNDREYFADSARYLIHNPAEYVLNSNVSEKEQVYVLENEALGKVTLSAGTEADYGLRHILARHTNKYFVNYKDKNKNTLFEDDITGKEIVIGLKEFY